MKRLTLLVLSIMALCSCGNGNTKNRSDNGKYKETYGYYIDSWSFDNQMRFVASYQEIDESGNVKLEKSWCVYLKAIIRDAYVSGYGAMLYECLIKNTTNYDYYLYLK